MREKNENSTLSIIRVSMLGVLCESDCIPFICQGIPVTNTLQVKTVNFTSLNEE